MNTKNSLEKQQRLQSIKKYDNSLAFINENQNQQGQRSSIAILNKKPETQLDTNKNFSCICVFNDRVYLGTRNSKLYIYKLKYSQSENEQQLSLTMQKIVTPHCQIVSLVAANERYFVTVPESDEDSLISIWETKNKMLLTAFKGHKSQISQIIFSKNNKNLISASWDCTIRVWDLQNLQRDQPLKVYTGNYPILVLKQLNEEVLVFGGDDCYLVFWNWKTDEIIKKQFGHAGSVTYIEIIDSYVFSAGGDNKFKLWQVTQIKQEPQLHKQMSKQQPVQDFKSKYVIKKIEQEKQQYDSIIFGRLIKKQLLLMDRQGEMFLFSKNKNIYRFPNQFEYNENITGIDYSGNHLLVTTTKGALKNFLLNQYKENVKTPFQDQLGRDNQLNLMRVNPIDQSKSSKGN